MEEGERKGRKERIEEWGRKGRQWEGGTEKKEKKVDKKGGRKGEWQGGTVTHFHLNDFDSTSFHIIIGCLWEKSAVDLLVTLFFFKKPNFSVRTQSILTNP